MKFSLPFLSRKSLFIVKQFQAKMRKKQLSFACLNACQFLGALNDNIYKLLTIFLLLSISSAMQASNILASVGALYVIPFLLFSSLAGILADRFSKQNFIMILKGIEIVLMGLAFFAFYTKSSLGCYCVLFLLATHSALFGPSKYSILPEIVEKANLTKANSQLTALTYLAIILGTFLASFLTEKTEGNFVISISFCLLFSIFGFIAALGIRKTPSQKSVKKMSLFFVKEIFQTVGECKKVPLLIPSLFGSAYFLLLGAFTQLNIIPFTLQSLHLSEYVGGYLFLLTALGIAGGSLVAGKFFKAKLTLNTSCLAGAALSLLLFSIAIFSSFLVPVMICLILLGICGSVFVIPFDTFIQVHSPEGKRGQTVAASNFFSFLGVLIASLCVYLFGDLLGLCAASGFFCMGIITAIATMALCLQTLEVFAPFLAKKLSPAKNSVILDS
jgi:acyl-[acyl-carrier-protein]-phospholipid O-acyltransferase / long-chain-fatty-acid--[acyl-carrier-protein] ligase